MHGSKLSRFIAAVLALIMLLCAAACGGKADTPGSDPSAPGGTDQPDPPQQEETVDETLSYDKGNRFDYPNTSIQSFDYNGVALSNDSAFRREFNYAMEYLLQIPTDDLLKTMRIREGKDVPGSSYMGGWYDGGLWVAATFGQYVSALARGYALTKDERLKAKATELLDGWADCISEDGFFYFSPDRETNSTHYTYDKVVLMCVDVYTYIGGDVGDRALEYLSTATDFAEGYLSRVRTNAGPDGPDSGQSVSGGNSDIEWYILSENLYRAYLATGEQKYKDFADVWNYNYFWEALRTGNASLYYNVHAYSHTNSVGGTALRYMLTRDGISLDQLKAAYNMYQRYELYPNGLYGTNERLVGNIANRASVIGSSVNNAEVPCNSWAGLKIVKYLTEITGSGDYGTWGEKLLYNGVLGTLRIKDDSVRRGITFYYASYGKNASKEYYGASWPCCSGTYFLNLCDVADQIYFKDQNNLYVSNFISSRAENLYGGKKVILTQEASFPDSSQVRMTVSCTDKADFGLKIRKPVWSDTVSVTLNGETVSAASENGWITVGTSFQNGDEIIIDFAPRLTLEYVDEGNSTTMMAMYGPVYMVAKEATSRNIVLAEGKDLADYIVGRNQNTFYVRDENDILFSFVPYFELGEGTEYAGNLSLETITGGEQ